MVDAVCHVQLRCCHVALVVLGRRHLRSDITSGVFNFVLCVHSFFIFFFHLVSITYTHTGDPVWLTEH